MHPPLPEEENSSTERQVLNCQRGEAGGEKKKKDKNLRPEEMNRDYARRISRREAVGSPNGSSSNDHDGESDMTLSRAAGLTPQGSTGWRCTMTRSRGMTTCKKRSPPPGAPPAWARRLRPLAPPPVGPSRSSCAARAPTFFPAMPELTREAGGARLPERAGLAAADVRPPLRPQPTHRRGSGHRSPLSPPHPADPSHEGVGRQVWPCLVSPTFLFPTSHP